VRNVRRRPEGNAKVLRSFAPSVLQARRPRSLLAVVARGATVTERGQPAGTLTSSQDARPKGAVSRLGELGLKGTHRNPEQDSTITLVLLAPSTESTFGPLKVRFSFAAPYVISRSNPSFVISVPLMGLAA
jgi:hypothetical protein